MEDLCVSMLARVLLTVPVTAIVNAARKLSEQATVREFLQKHQDNRCA